MSVLGLEERAKKKKEEKVKILMVDDEINILNGFKRHLNKFFSLTTAVSAEEAISACERQGPFAVVVSDQRMPEMDGVEFLSIVKNRYPDSVRMMLTGQADFKEAIEAVNKGNIFRFLTKPCDSRTLATALRDAVEQYNLLKAEKVLLNKTLMRSVQVLVKVLSISNPFAFGRSTQVARVVKLLARMLRYPRQWELEMATLLSHLGVISLPEKIQAKKLKGVELSSSDQVVYDTHPEIAYKMINEIPRLEAVAEMVRDQNKLFNESKYKKSMGTPQEIVLLGQQIIRVAFDFDDLIEKKGQSEYVALAEMIKKTKKGEYNKKVIEALKGIIFPDTDPIEITTIEGLEHGMILAEAIQAENGSEIVAEGLLINSQIIEQLQKVPEKIEIQLPIKAWK